MDFLDRIVNNKNTNLLNFMVDKANINYRVVSGWTLLHYAAFYDKLKIAKYLLDNGADPTLKNDMGFTPIDKVKNNEMRNLLMKYEK